MGFRPDPAFPKRRAQSRIHFRQLRQRLVQAAMNKKSSDRRPVSNEGSIVERKPLTVWEQYAQALLFTNEITYVN